MIGWLQLTPEQRRASLTVVEYTTGIAAKAVEKDWWVTLTLRALFQSKYSEHLVFKGGTSLSKCWNLINRFSEDIDISLSPEVFGMTHEENPTKSYVENLKRAGCLFISNEFKDELITQLRSLGLTNDLVTLIAEPIPSDHPDTDPQVLHLRYPSLYPPIQYIADEVKIEIGVRSSQAPYSQAEIQSILSKENSRDSYGEEPFSQRRRCTEDIS